MSKNVMNKKRDKIYLFIALPLSVVAIALWTTAIIVLSKAGFSFWNVKQTTLLICCLFFGGIAAMVACALFYALLKRRQAREQVLVSTKVCPSCGLRTNKRHSFCPSCGNTFESENEEKGERA